MIGVSGLTRAILLSILIHTLWGGIAVAAKFGLEVFPPFLSAGIRFVFGVVTIWCWCLFRKIPLWPQPGEWKPILLIAIFFTVQIALMNVGIDNTSGSSASILISTNPLFAAVFAHFLIGDDRLTLARSAGLLLAFCGVVMTLVYSKAVQTDQALVQGAQTLQNTFHFGTIGDWLCLLSAALLGFRLIASARAMRKLDPIRLALWQMILSIPAFFTMGLLFESVAWENMSWRAWAGLAYQGVVIAGIGFMLTLWLISRYRPSLMASFNFIAPVSGVLLSVWLLDERLNPAIIASVALVALGMVILTIKSPESSEK